VPDYMVLKQVTSDPTGQAKDWDTLLIVRGVEDEEAAVEQAYTGEGTYKPVEWDEDVEVRATAGKPELTTVSKRAIEEAEETEAVPVQ
jgi:hypothetical protein